MHAWLPIENASPHDDRPANKVGIENGKRHCRDCGCDGDVDPKLDDVEAARRTEQGCSQHNHEHQRLDEGLQSDRHWMIHIADIELDIARNLCPTPVCVDFKNIDKRVWQAY